MRKVLAVLMTPFLLILIYLGIQDYKNAMLEPGIDWVDIACWTAIGIEILAGGLYYQRRTSTGAAPLSDSQKDAAVKRAASTGFGLTLMATIGFFLASAILNSSGQGVPILLPVLIMPASIASAGMFTVHLARTQS
jgi:hypothetical protein